MTKNPEALPAENLTLALAHVLEAAREGVEHREACGADKNPDTEDAIALLEHSLPLFHNDMTKLDPVYTSIVMGRVPTEHQKVASAISREYLAVKGGGPWVSIPEHLAITFAVAYLAERGVGA